MSSLNTVPEWLRVERAATGKTLAPIIRERILCRRPSTVLEVLEPDRWYPVRLWHVGTVDPDTVPSTNDGVVIEIVLDPSARDTVFALVSTDTLAQLHTAADVIESYNRLNDQVVAMTASPLFDVHVGDVCELAALDAEMGGEAA